jgi:TolB protein
MILLLAAVASVAPAQDAPLPWAADDEVRLPTELVYVDGDGGLAWSPAGPPDPRPLGRSDARYAFPTFAPEGDRIAVIERQDGRARAVVLTPPAAPSASAEREVWFDDPGAPVIYLDWRDDGRALLLLVGDAGGFTLRLVTPDADDRVLARGAPLFWDQGPGGLVVHVGGPGPAQLARIDAEGRTVARYDAPGAFRSPAVSPSGSWTAYAERVTGDVRRAVIVRDAAEADDAGAADPSDDAATRRALDVRGVTAFAWHPQRDLLALTRPLANVPHSFGPLGGLDAASGLFEPWTDASVMSFAWSPDGRRIGVLATPSPGGERIAATPVPPSRPLAGTWTAGTSGGGAPPAEGLAIAAAARAIPDPRLLQAGPLRLPLGLLDPERAEVVWLGTVVPQASYLNERVPFFDQYARSHRSWSPDGRYWGLSLVAPDGRDVVAVLDVRTGRLHAIAPGTAPAFAP